MPHLSPGEKGEGRGGLRVGAEARGELGEEDGVAFIQRGMVPTLP